MAPALACEEVKAEDVNVTYVRDVSTNLTGVLCPTAEYITHTMATGIVLEENRVVPGNYSRTSAVLQRPSMSCA